MNYCERSVKLLALTSTCCASCETSSSHGDSTMLGAPPDSVSIAPSDPAALLSPLPRSLRLAEFLTAACGSRASSQREWGGERRSAVWCRANHNAVPWHFAHSPDQRPSMHPRRPVQRGGMPLATGPFAWLQGTRSHGAWADNPPPLPPPLPLAMPHSVLSSLHAHAPASTATWNAGDLDGLTAEDGSHRPNAAAASGSAPWMPPGAAACSARAGSSSAPRRAGTSATDQSASLHPPPCSLPPPLPLQPSHGSLRLCDAATSPWAWRGLAVRRLRQRQRYDRRWSPASRGTACSGRSMTLATQRPLTTTHPTGAFSSASPPPPPSRERSRTICCHRCSSSIRARVADRPEGGGAGSTAFMAAGDVAAV
jgi:hypothetical protein